MKPTKESVITLSLFAALTITFYFIGYWLIFRMSKATPLMLSVGVAAIVTCIIRKQSLSTLGWCWGSWKYAWLSYLIPLSLAALAYFFIWFTGFGEWYNESFVSEQKTAYNIQDWSDLSTILFHLLLTASITFFISLPSVLGEEIAWRGFLVPQLSKFLGFVAVALTSGLMWALWHWPLIIQGLYGNGTTPLWYQLTTFTVFIMSSAMIMTYLRYKSGSLWTAVIYHMSSNVFIQKFFTPLTSETHQSVWVIDEFGFALPVLATLVACYFCHKGKQSFKNTYNIS
ncbi:CPBP family intramembrane glutamic endopeptidase [Marinicella rhabdoformis]|uniref:CPBP family intramembrane glutamic endopeptidase n=1 Tax=Marinicella rhabdoformis TaxID=2580566 RepID=UPI0012AEDD80|nr:type II CAAX endopeptidase family protein [Marinicella rhabdoformis]